MQVQDLGRLSQSFLKPCVSVYPFSAKKIKTYQQGIQLYSIGRKMEFHGLSILQRIQQV